MNITEYILKDAVTFHSEDAIEFVLENTQKQLFTHALIVEDKKLICTIPIRDIDTLEENAKKINEISYLNEYFSSHIDDTLFEILNFFTRNETNILPVIDADHNYLGYYDLNDVLNFFSDSPFFNEEGIALLIEKTTKNYSFSEITQIVETNNAKLFGLYVSNINETNTQITLKVRTENINELIQSFRRYDYNILSNHSDDDYLEDLKNRSQYLQKYLNI